MRPGWRIGYLAFYDPDEKIEQVTETTRKVWEMYGHQAYGMPVPLKYSAIKAFEGSLDESKKMVKELEVRRNYSMKRIGKIDWMECYQPEGAYYLFPKLTLDKTNWTSVNDFLIDLLKKEKITFLPGSKFGKHGEKYFRMIFLPKIEILEYVFDSLENFYNKSTQ
jgi:alanine-synthesizing transaminase